MATIAEHGDPSERKHWPTVREFFPLYEPFWERLVVPFRGPNGKTRPEAGADLEFLAQTHYKCFHSLRLAHKKLEETRHAEQTFSHLQNAAKRARETVMRFNQLYGAWVHAGDAVPDADFGTFGERIAPYRNAVHDDILPKRLTNGDVYIPRADRLARYALWSALAIADPADFVLLRDQVNGDFNDLCRLITAGWTAMLGLTDALVQSAEYRKRLPVTNTIIMHRAVLSSNTSEGS